MERLLLRRLPRLPALLVYVTAALFAACALYTLYYDRRPPSLQITSPGLDAISISRTFRDENLSGAAQKPMVDRRPETGASQSGRRNESNAITIQEADKRNTHAKDATREVKKSNSEVKIRNLKDKLTTASPDTCDSKGKLILLWTSFFGYWEYVHQSKFNKCRGGCRNCEVTSDRSRLLEADAVVLHARDMAFHDLPLHRSPAQVWVFYCLESPPNSDFAGLHYMRHLINWTMTYRADSDVPAPYGTLTRLHPPRRLDLAAAERAWRGKSRSVVWLSSNCGTVGGRDALVAQLARHVDVDVYGDCGSLVCPRGQSDACLADFAKKYRFFLAFENSICKDYVTEKLYRTLQYDIIPVVMGGADYSKFVPEGSYIDALSFKSPKHLAFFLAGVGADFRLYSGYFRWRQHFSISLENAKECQLCDLLHRKDRDQSLTKSYPDLRDWWVTQAHCRTWSPNR